MTIQSVSRRSFLVGSGASAVGIMLGGGSLASLAQAAHHAEKSAGFSPVAWVSIAPDNTTLIYSPAAEMGQGTMTSIPAILAEDMELDWSKVRVEQAPTVAKLFGNPKFGGGMVTGSSRTVVGYYEVMRLAGLQAKLALVNIAAQAWGVPAKDIVAEKSVLKHAASKRQMTYGEAAAQAKGDVQPPAVEKSMLKPMSQFKIIGTDQPRVDLPAKSNGSAKFGIDFRMPGMVWASVLYTPVQGDKPETVDDTAARAVKGVKDVIKLPFSVAVVADSFATARKARDLLKVTWTTTSPARSYDSDQALKDFVGIAEKTEVAGDIWHAQGDALAAIKGAARTLAATFTTEHVAQCTMEPMNCTARIDGDKAYGLGISDDKQGIALIIHTVALLQKLNFKDYGTLTVLINGDEEISSPGWRSTITRVAAEQDVVLSFEGGGTDGTLRLATSGIGAAYLTVQGKASHAGAKPEDGVNALYELSHQLLQMKDLS